MCDTKPSPLEKIFASKSDRSGASFAKGFGKMREAIVVDEIYHSTAFSRLVTCIIGRLRRPMLLARFGEGASD